MGEKNSISGLLCKVIINFQGACSCVHYMYLHSGVWVMHETKIAFHLQNGKKHSYSCALVCFFPWNWLDTKVRRNSEEIQLTSLVNHAWYCNQGRWQNLNFPKQVWNPWQMRRQIIVMIQGALREWFRYWLVLEDTSPSNNPTSSTRIIIAAIFPSACKV